MTSSVWLKWILIVACFAFVVSLNAEDDYLVAELVDTPSATPSPSPVLAELETKVTNKEELLPMLAAAAGGTFLAGKALNAITGNSNNAQRNGRRQDYTGAARISIADARCVFCQYFVQRVEADTKIMMSMEEAPALLEVAATDSEAKHVTPEQLSASFLEARAQVKQKEKILPMLAAGMGAAYLAKKAIGGVSSMVSNLAGMGGKPGGGVDEGRFRPIDMRQYMGADVRMARARPIGGLAAQAKAEEDFFYRQMYQTEFPAMRFMCMQRMPPEFYHVCGALLENWRAIVTGIWWKDRAADVCKKLEMCSMASYIYNAPHQTSAPIHPGDAEPGFLKSAWNSIKQRGQDLVQQDA